MLMITPASTNPLLTARGLWNVIRVFGQDNQQGPLAGAFIAAHFKGRSIAIVDNGSNYGRGLTDGVQKTLKAAHVPVALTDSLPSDRSDTTNLVSRLKDAKIDVVYFGGWADQAAQILRRSRENGLDFTLVAPDGIYSQNFASEAGAGAAGTIMTFGRDVRKVPSAQPLMAELTRAGTPANDIGPYTIASYAAVQVVAAGIKAANSNDPRKISQSLKTGKSFATALGALRFDKVGDVTPSAYGIFVWSMQNDGTLQPNELP
jgi:branched-chain amino acid transport system substrate-binding protein